VCSLSLGSINCNWTDGPARLVYSTARVVLPEPEIVTRSAESDVEEDEAEEDVDGDSNDILAELPDDTDVRLQLSHAQYNSLTRRKLTLYMPDLRLWRISDSLASPLPLPVSAYARTSSPTSIRPSSAL
jgi:hypothetical protein